MLEVVLATLFVTVAVLAIGSRSPAPFLSASGDVVVLTDEDDIDLPCPWCSSPTAESDRECPSCRQPFG